MTRRKIFGTLAALALAPLADAQQDKVPWLQDPMADRADIDQSNLIASMINFNDRWNQLKEDYARSEANHWDIKQAYEVEKYFQKMVRQPGWISGHKI